MTARPQREGAAAGGAARPRPAWLRAAGEALLWAALGAALIAALSQLPARHTVAVGGYDAAYVQGFHEPEAGGGRWTRASSALLFPQAGLPGQVALSLSGPPDGPPAELAILLNGAVELERRAVGAERQTIVVPVSGGLLKATDFFVELRSTTTALPDGREVGVLVDEATYTAGPGPLMPYPAQVLYGALAGALLALLTRPLAEGRGTRDAGEGLGRRAGALLGRRATAAGLALYALLWLLLYRLQPPLYPHPLRALPLWAVGALAAALALRDGPALAARWPRLVSAAAPAAVIGAWLAATLLLAQGHVTLSRPGVENDFRVFATRESLGQVFSADGFYNLGYPLLLWLARPLFAGNAFLAGRLVAALSGAALLGAGYWLARSLAPSGPALAALVALALSGLVAQYGLYVGSDMPFAACLAACAAALVAAGRGGAGRRALLLCAAAGLFGGLAFLMRHLGLVLLPWGLAALLLGRAGPRATAAYAAAFLLAMAPQVVVNVAQAGDPLYNQQAKNIWLAVYGGTDWGRWEEAPNTIGLAEVVLRDPARFLENWWRNVAGFLGRGAEDTSEFGRADQLRLLGFPANWLAAGALLAWLAAPLRRPRGAPPAAHGPRLGLLLLVALYVAAVSTAFTLPRFFLPLAPLYAAAAGWALWRLAGGGRALLAAALALVVVLWGGHGAGARYVLAGQPADEVAIVRMVEAATPPEAMIAARVSGRLPVAKYSAIGHRVVEWPAGGDLGRAIGPEDLAEAMAAGATFLLWDEAGGPPPLADPGAALVADAGRYALYRLAQ